MLVEFKGDPDAIPIITIPAPVPPTAVLQTILFLKSLSRAVVVAPALSATMAQHPGPRGAVHAVIMVA